VPLLAQGQDRRCDQLDRRQRLGQSTFLRCINFLEQPNDGAMTLDGQQIRMVSDRHGMRVADDAELQRLRTRLAMVFQHFNLWSHMSVLENITMAPRRVLGLQQEGRRGPGSSLPGQGWAAGAGGGSIPGVFCRVASNSG